MRGGQCSTIVDARTVARRPSSFLYTAVSEAESTRLDMTARGLSAVVRASPHYFVSPDDVAAAVRAVSELAR